MEKQYKNSKDYEQFVEKFKQKKTTDDCYTPPIIYDAVSGWVCKEYGVTPDQIVRPFYPGGDFENFEYPKGCVVLQKKPPQKKTPQKYGNYRIEKLKLSKVWEISS